MAGMLVAEGGRGFTSGFTAEVAGGSRRTAVTYLTAQEHFTLPISSAACTPVHGSCGDCSSYL